MGLLQTSGAPADSTRARTSSAAVLAAALLAVLATTACVPEVESVPAESVAASESADPNGATTPAGTPTKEPALKSKRKATGAPSDPGGAAGDDAGPAGTQRVTAGPVTFAAPSGWQGFDQRRLEEMTGRAWLRRIATRMGLTYEQMMASVEATDLMLVSTEGAAQGFADNLNVVTIPGSMPADEQLRQQFLAVGAGIRAIEHNRTGLGDAVSLTYDLEVGDLAIAGEVVMVEIGGRTTTLTVSALDRDVTRKVAGLARDTLAAAR